MDDKALSFNEKWNSLANHFFNAPDFQPENDFVDADSRISDIDPRLAPALPWTGESLRKTFRGLKTKFALVDDMFSCSGNIEAGADIDEADHFDGHVKRVLENESPTLHKVMLFSLRSHPSLFLEPNLHSSNLILPLKQQNLQIQGIKSHISMYGLVPRQMH